MADNNSKMDILDFGDGDVTDSIIEVIGAGGSGGDAVNHIYKEGIHDITFVFRNTDAQALSDSPVPIHLQLGKEELDAGNRPERIHQAVEETIEDIKHILNDGTKMAFIAAGMSGGTGIDAAPVIARVSKELGILTVDIVTIPFRFEGAKRIDQALDGVEEMAKHVDALLVVNNERLREIYPELSLLSGFCKAGGTLSMAAKSITEIITIHDIMNLDFNDVRTVLKDGGVAIMSTGYGEGEGCVKQVVEDALNSPLLNDNDVCKSKKILLSISFNTGDKDNSGLTMEEMGDMTEFMSHFSADFELKWGLAIDPEFDKKVKVTTLVTGFGIKDVDGVGSHIEKQAQEDAARQTEEEEKAAERRDRCDRFYRDNNSLQYEHCPHIYRLTADELDSKDAILAVESTPTYERTKQMAKNIKRISNPEQDNEENESNEGVVEGVISFV